MTPQVEKEPRRTPVCGYCGADPLTIAAIPTTVGGNPVIVFYCGALDCRKTYNIVPTQVERRVHPASRLVS